MSTGSTIHERVCNWCGAATPAAYPVCQKCNRHTKNPFSYIAMLGFFTIFAMLSLATYQYWLAQQKQIQTVELYKNAKNTLAQAKAALEIATVAGEKSSTALATARESLELAAAAAEEAAIAQSRVKDTLADRNKPITKISKPTKAASPNIVKRSFQPPQETLKTKLELKPEKVDRTTLLNELKKAQQKLAVMNQEFDEKNGDMRFLSTKEEYLRNREEFTQPVRAAITRLEKELQSN